MQLEENRVSAEYELNGNTIRRQKMKSLAYRISQSDESGMYTESATWIWMGTDETDFLMKKDTYCLFWMKNFQQIRHKIAKLTT